jgi:TonB family protein
MVKTALYLAGFYLIYHLFLSKDTFYNRNRLFILSSVVISFVMPLITINIRDQENLYYFGKRLSEIIVTARDSGRVGEPGTATGISTITICHKVYFAGVTIAGLKLLADLTSLLVMISRQRAKGSQIIYFSGFRSAGFSAMGYIFINSSLNKNEAEEIIRHEQNHIDQNHFLDILFIEVIKTIQWFNPVIYLFNRSLRAVHEYQADKGYLKSGVPVIRYQSLLLDHVFRSGRFSMTNSFSNPSLLKKRMIMMIKVPSGKLSNFKIVLVIPVVVLLLSVISAFEKNSASAGSSDAISSSKTGAIQPFDIIKAQVYKESAVNKSSALNPDLSTPPPPPPPPPENNKVTNTESGIQISGEKSSVEAMDKIPDEIFVVVEDMPTFPGGDNALMKYINGNINYPEAAREKYLEGRVILRFAVMASGKVSNVTVLKSVDPDLDKEAIRVVQTLPDWTPGKQGGKPVNVWYSVPIVFQLK